MYNVMNGMNGRNHSISSSFDFTFFSSFFPLLFFLSFEDDSYSLPSSAF